MEVNAETEVNISGDDPLICELLDIILNGALKVSKKSTASANNPGFRKEEIFAKR
jgi:hypothetical protein